MMMLLERSGHAGDRLNPWTSQCAARHPIPELEAIMPDLGCWPLNELMIPAGEFCGDRLYPNGYLSGG
jgi:hypothetical protein